MPTENDFYLYSVSYGIYSNLIDSLYIYILFSYLINQTNLIKLNHPFNIWQKAAPSRAAKLLFRNAF